MDKLEALKKIGSEWQKGDRHRIYFNDLATLAGLDIDRYGTGNISGATLDGRTISNSEAKRIVSRLLDTKVWFDVADGKFHWQAPAGSDDWIKRILTAIRAKRDELVRGAQNVQ